jgi:urease accessory protein
LLELSFRETNGETILVHRRFAHPLQALEPFRASDGSLCMLMLNISGGMVGGDRLGTTVEVGDHAHAVLSTASAGKAYRTLGAAAIQRTRISLGANAMLEYLPDHLIPYAGAAVDQKIEVEMSRGSGAIIYDAFAAGRIGRAERWRFHSLRSDIAITTHGVPIYLSRSIITPDTQPLDAAGWMEGANYWAAMLVVAADPHDWLGMANAFHAALEEISDVRGGASALAHGGCVARFISVTADGLNRTAIQLWGIARRRLIGREAFPLRKL